MWQEQRFKRKQLVPSMKCLSAMRDTGQGGKATVRGWQGSLVIQRRGKIGEVRGYILSARSLFKDRETVPHRVKWTKELVWKGLVINKISVFILQDVHYGTSWNPPEPIRPTGACARIYRATGWSFDVAVWTDVATELTSPSELTSPHELTSGLNWRRRLKLRRTFHTNSP